MSKRILFSFLAVIVIVPAVWFLRNNDDSVPPVVTTPQSPRPQVAPEVVESGAEEVPIETAPVPEPVKPPETELEKQIFAQETKVENRREALRKLVRGERPPAPAPAAPGEDAKLGPDSPEYQAAKSAFETEWKLLEELRRKQLKE